MAKLSEITEKSKQEEKGSPSKAPVAGKESSEDGKEDQRASVAVAKKA